MPCQIWHSKCAHKMQGRSAQSLERAGEVTGCLVCSCCVDEHHQCLALDAQIEANASRPEGLAPSQGGKYVGFGSGGSAPARPASGAGFDQVSGALASGWTQLSSAAGAFNALLCLSAAALYSAAGHLAHSPVFTGEGSRSVLSLITHYALTSGSRGCQKKADSCVSIRLRCSCGDRLQVRGSSIRLVGSSARQFISMGAPSVQGRLWLRCAPTSSCSRALRWRWKRAKNMAPSLGAFCAVCTPTWPIRSRALPLSTDTRWIWVSAPVREFLDVQAYATIRTCAACRCIRSKECRHVRC